MGKRGICILEVNSALSSPLRAVSKKFLMSSNGVLRSSGGFTAIVVAGSFEKAHHFVPVYAYQFPSGGIHH
jgi:hypothetical protein